jgi:hypothetical protein
MDYVLSSNLPPELVDDICRRVHESYMRDICNEIKYNIVWVRLKNEMPSFLIGTLKSNTYYPLLDFDNIVGVTVITLR